MGAEPEVLDFIPDVPAGPLDEYRKRATFDWKRLKLAIERCPERIKIKYHIWKTLENDPLFANNLGSMTVEEKKHLTAMQVEKINQNKFDMKEKFTVANYRKRTRHLMTVNEAIQALNPNVSVKMAIGIHLFNNTVLGLGTERHLEIFEKVWSREVLSSISLTEVAHGSNTKALRTTATYDPKTQEFIINTPDFEAAKCWIGNLGKTCTWTLVFAQLITADGTHHGVHAFVTPIRDPKTFMPYPGLVIGDIGEKIGLNGIDNGFIMFNHYRVKRECLLNRIADVTPEGEYVSKLTDPNKILGAALETLLAGRIGIMQESVQTLTSAITIAIRYAALRKQFGEEEDKEMPIIEYQLHQWRIFPLLAATVVYKLFVFEFTEYYLDIIQKSYISEKLDDLSDIVSEIHAIVSSCKPLLTWAAVYGAQECREACGGHGYLKAANLGELRSNHDATVTYEGDNNVLRQQASNWLIRQLENHNRKTPVCSPLNTLSFLDNMSTIINAKFVATNANDIATEQFLLTSYQWLICWLLKTTHENIEIEMGLGKSKFEARCNSQVYRASLLSKVYAEYVSIYLCGQVVAKIEQEYRPLLRDLLVLYGLSSLEQHLVLFYQGGYTTDPRLADWVKHGVLEKCGALKDVAVSVVDALAHPDFATNSVLGKADGKLYDHLQSVFFHSPGSLERAPWWSSIAKSKL